MVWRFCAFLEVSPINNNNDDQVQLFPIDTFCFLLQFGYCADFALLS